MHLLVKKKSIKVALGLQNKNGGKIMKNSLEFDEYFREGQSYNNVYFLKIDASGHSNIVLLNTDDIVNKMFDLLETMIFSAVEENRKIHNCKYATFWGWQGDGGLCVICDENESASLQTAIQSAFNILNFKLNELRHTIGQLKAKGDLHLRLSVHRGSFTYKGYDRHGSIHSKDLNFVSHLEEVTPKDCLTISKEVYQRCPSSIADLFIPLDFSFEETEIFLYTNGLHQSVMFEWISNIPIAESATTNVLPRRYSEQDKARIIQHATTEVIDLGTALRTCSYYLISRHRPRFYRPIVTALLEKGVNYICIALNPDSEIAQYYGSSREDDLIANTHGSICRMEQFADDVKDLPGKFELYLYSQLPYFASIMIDRKNEGLLLYAPYMSTSNKLTIERADSPHVLVPKSRIPHLFDQVDSYIDYLLQDPKTIKHI